MRKLDKTWKKLLYALAGMGVNMLNLMMNSYLCSALLIGGFGEEAIKNQTFAGVDLIVPAVWTVFAFISKIIDGIIDIPMASLTDNLKSKWGRRRPALVMGFIPMIAAYVLFLCVPNSGAATVLNTVYFGVLLCIFYIGYTLTMVTYYATFTEIVDNAKDRAFISNSKAFFDIVYYILGYVVVSGMLKSTNIKTVALIVLPMSLTMLIAFFMIKEKSTKDGVKGEKSEAVNLIKSITYTLKNRPFVLWMVIYSVMTVGVQLFLGGINEYFSYVGMNMMFVMMGAFAPVPFTLILYNRMMKKRGFGVAFKVSLIIYSLGMISMFLAGILFDKSSVKTIISIMTGVISSFAIGSLFSVAYFVPSQLAAEEEDKTGIKSSAMYFAVQGLFAGIASGLATGVILTLLKTHTDVEADKAASVNSGPMAYMTLIAGVVVFIAALLMSKLPQSIKDIGKEAK